VIEFYKSYLQSLGHFIIIASGYLVQSITFILILFGSKKLLGINALIISLISSMILQIIVINFYILKKKIWPIISFRLTSIHKSIISIAFPLLIAHSLTLLVNFFIVFLVSGYPAGFVTMHNYGQLISFLPGLFFFTPLLDVISVRLSELYHTDLKKMVDKLIYFQSVVILILTPIMLFFIIYRYDITKVLFLRGSFNIENVIQTSNILMIYSITIVSTALVQIISRVYYIMQKTSMTSILAIIFQLLTLGFSFFLTKYFGFWGLPIGKVFIDILIVLPISFWLLNKYLTQFNIKIIIYDFVKIFMLCIIL
jgi:peptidoglycan biosynthesis protein MviN/MurJ (putative lipid II flippase)